MKNLLEIEPFEFDIESESGPFSDEFESEIPPINLSNPEFVRWIQSSLNKLNGAGLAVDGIVGPITRWAVRSFQQQQGLVVDGIVGPQTAGRIQQLLGGILPQPQPTPPPTPTPFTTTDRWVLPNDVRAVGEAQTVRYDKAGPWIGPSGCAREHTPGAKELGRYIQTNFPGVSKIDWVVVCRPNTANASAMSMHGVGRALDIYIPMRAGRANSTVGDPIAHWLIQNASAIGIQYIIWNRSDWDGSKRAPKHGAYRGPDPHINHIHAELNRDGAERRTPWFRRSQPTPAPIPVPTPQQPSGPPIVRPTLAVGVNYPPPPGYRAMRSVSKEIVAKANEILRRPEPIGTIFPVILGGKDYMFVLEWHKHAQGAPGDPLLNWHRGVTVYERIGGAQLPVPVPLPPPPPPTPPSYSPSATRRRFEEAVARGDWQQAYLNLNGLNMYEMLRTLDGLSYERCNALLQQRENYRGMVNMPRIEYAAEVVQTGRLPSIAPGDLEATGQVETAREFLGSRRSQPGRSSSSPKYIRWVQNSLNQILGLRLAVDGISGPQTRSAIRSFQQRRGLTVDGIVGPQTEAALIAAGAGPPPGGGTAPAPRPGQGGAVDWTQVPQNNRVVYVMRRLTQNYSFPENGAAGLVGNLWAESGLLPNRLEGSAMNTPMRAPDFNGQMTNFTAEQIMNRDSGRRQGPRLPGVGLAQWTAPSRRSGLFQHSYGGRQLGTAILFDMDAQIDFLVKELTASYRQVHSLLMDSRVTWEAASDEVVYSFETPGAILGPPDPVTGRRQRLPRNNPSVQQVFMQRRTHAGRALNLYLQPTQETDFAFGEQEFGFGNETLSLGSGLRSGIESLMVRSAIRGGTTDENQLTNLILFRRHPERNGRAISRSEPDFQQVSQEWLRIRETIVRPILQGSHSNPSASPTPTQTPTPRPAPGQPPSTTSGVEAAGNTMRIINCITRLVDQGRPISFVVRYLRDLRRAEAAALSSAGIKIVSCYEARSSTGVSPTSMAYFTRAQGQHDGRRGFTQAQAVGQPAEKPVYFAVDTDPTVRQRQAILDYFQGVRDGYYQYLADMQAQGKRAVTYAIGVYGSGCVLDWSAAQGIVTLFWQAFAPGWCNNRRVWPGANIHTSGRDQPERCRWRLGRLEGWGNEGGW